MKETERKRERGKRAGVGEGRRECSKKKGGRRERRTGGGGGGGGVEAGA